MSAVQTLFLGCWSFRPNNVSGKKNFGYRSHVVFRAPLDHNGIFVVPRARQVYAVDVKLLRFMTDELQFSGGTMTSCLRVWANQHPEAMQHLGSNLRTCSATVLGGTTRMVAPPRRQLVCNMLCATHKQTILRRAVAAE